MAHQHSTFLRQLPNVALFSHVVFERCNTDSDQEVRLSSRSHHPRCEIRMAWNSEELKDFDQKIKSQCKQFDSLNVNQANSVVRYVSC